MPSSAIASRSSTRARCPVSSISLRNWSPIRTTVHSGPPHSSGASLIADINLPLLLRRHGSWRLKPCFLRLVPKLLIDPCYSPSRSSFLHMLYCRFVYSERLRLKGTALRLRRCCFVRQSTSE